MVQPEGVRVAVDVMSVGIIQAEYDRFLIVENGSGSRIRRSLGKGVGTLFSDTNLYRDHNGNLVTASSYEGVFIVSLKTLSAITGAKARQEITSRHRGRATDSDFCFGVLPSQELFTLDQETRPSAYFDGFTFLASLPSSTSTLRSAVSGLGGSCLVGEPMSTWRTLVPAADDPGG
jgi:hypothetical protein